MTYYYLVRKQLLNFLLIAFVTTIAYCIANIWGMANPIVQAKDFFWIAVGAILTYLFVLPLIMLLLEKKVD